MTKQQYDKLTPYKNYFDTALNGNSIRALTNAQVDDLIKIASGLGITYKNNHCPVCLLNFIKKLGTQYNSYVPPIKKETSDGKKKKK